MKNNLFNPIHFIQVTLLSGVLTLMSLNSQAAVSESCDCTIDTAGYAGYVSTLMVADVPMAFHVHNNFAVAIGYINSNTPSVVQSLINNHPNVTTIVMLNSGGSEDDQANLNASQMLRNAGYNMYLPSNGEIASGAVDMFFAGVRRVIDVGAQVGVHSWSDGVNDATFYPVGHANHQPYIDYYVNMGLTQQESEAFYYFTINAAPAASIYWMTEAEIDQYKLRTCKYSNNPTYSVSQNGATLTADLAGATYQWIDCNNGNQPISGEINQSFTPASNGSYAVQITESNCNGTSACTEVQSVGLTESELNERYLFPNPVKNQLNVSFLHDGEELLVVDVHGNELLYLENGTKLNVSEIVKGTYFVMIFDRDELVFIQKFIKE